MPNAGAAQTLFRPTVITDLSRPGDLSQYDPNFPKWAT